MKTIIFCGGIGYRLKEETEFKPKPMVYVGSDPTFFSTRFYTLYENSPNTNLHRFSEKKTIR